jgi:tetratricopeptide (TPR) repeat protein
MLGSAGVDRIPELRFGRYEIIELVGVGGMGRVFRARDPELGREVAIKVLRDVSPEAQARMLREARTMASLSHPNVVPVYDVDTDGDDVFIVMELVRGHDLRAWLSQGPHPWREVVRVFAAAGRGLEAAHAAGLVHRDFKPANVMLGDDRVRVMDFGLARSARTDASGSGEITAGVSRDPLDDGITRDGAIVGTPHYMGPEIETGASATVATDQYAFCMALYEALYDQKPFAGPSRERVWQQKWSVDIQPAPRDSTVPSELFDICVHGMRADPRDRFASMSAVVAALERTLQRKPARTYVAGIVIVGALAASSTWVLAARDRCDVADEMLREVWNDERRASVRDVAKAGLDEDIDAYFESWRHARRGLCEGEAPTDVDRYRACLDGQLRQGAAVVDVLLQASPDAIENASAVIEGLPEIESCADPDRRDRLQPPPELADEVASARTVQARVTALKRLGDFDEAQRVLDEELADVEFCPVQAETMLLRGVVAEARGDYDTAIDSLQHAYDTADVCAHHDVAFEAARFASVIEGRHHANAEAADEWFGHAKSHLALVEEPVLDEIVLLYTRAPDVYRAGRPEEGLALAERAVELLDGLPEPEPALRAEALANRGSIYGWAAREHEAHADLKESARLYEEVHGPEHHKTAMGLMNLSTSLRTLGRYEEAAAMQQRGVEMMRAAVGSEHPWMVKGLTSLGQVMHENGRLDEGEAHVREALQIAEKVFGSDDFELAHPLRTLAEMQASRGDQAGGLATRQRVVDLQARMGRRNEVYAMDLRHLAEDLIAAKRYDEAESKVDEAMEIIVELGGSDHPDLGQAYSVRAYLFHERKEFARAEQDFVRAVKLLEPLADGGSYELGEVLDAYAMMLVDAGRPAEARPVLERALAIYDATKAWPEATQRARELLARLPAE